MSTAKRRCWWQSPAVACCLSCVLDRRLLPKASLTAAPRMDTAGFREASRATADPKRVADHSASVVVRTGPCRRRRWSESVDERRERLQRDSLIHRRATAFQIALAWRSSTAAIVDPTATVGASHCRQLESKRLVNACTIIIIVVIGIVVQCRNTMTSIKVGAAMGCGRSYVANLLRLRDHFLTLTIAVTTASHRPGWILWYEAPASYITFCWLTDWLIDSYCADYKHSLRTTVQYSSR